MGGGRRLGAGHAALELCPAARGKRKIGNLGERGGLIVVRRSLEENKGKHLYEHNLFRNYLFYKPN